jgi:hypothetical protein
MKTKKITAVFQGQNGSLGYEHGKEYQLMIGVSRDKIIIERLNNQERTMEGFCEYGSIMSFLDNWDSIKAI